MEVVWILLTLLGPVFLESKSVCGYPFDEYCPDGYSHEHDYDYYEAHPSNEVNQVQDWKKGKGDNDGGNNFWQFKKSSQESDPWKLMGWSEGGVMDFEDSGWTPPSSGWSEGRRPVKNDRGKTSIVIQVPSVLAKLFRKKKKFGGKPRRPPPHTKYAPAYISYGPIHGPPPPPLLTGYGETHQSGWTQQPVQPTVLSHRASTTAPSTEYGVPSQNSAGVPSHYSPPTAGWSSWSSPQESFQSNPSPPTTPFTFPAPTVSDHYPTPTYGPTYQVSQPEQQHQPQYETQHPSQHQPQNPPQHQPQHQPQNRPQYQPQNRPQHQPQNRPQHQPQNRPQHQPQNRPQHQPQNRPEHQPQNRPQHRPQNRPQHQSRNRPQNQPKNRPQYQQQQPPGQTQNSHFSVTNQQPTRYQKASEWGPVTGPEQGTRVAVVIEQSRELKAPRQERKPSTTNPPYSKAPEVGWTAWGDPPPNQMQPPRTSWRKRRHHFNQNRRHSNIPMNFGPPMHNFGPPHSSYGQPPPIIGDPPHDRYAPEKEIYRYPTKHWRERRNQPKWTKYQFKEAEDDDYNDVVSESEEFYQYRRKPSRKLKMPRKPYHEPHRRYVKDVREVRPRFKSQYSRSHTQDVGEVSHDHGYPNARPPPNFDTNYNSPGLSKNPKIVDWMPYSAKNYYDLPGKKKKRKPRYRTLPTSLRHHRPDPEHEKYPKLTYDTLLSKRTLVVSPKPTPSPQNLKSMIGKSFERNPAWPSRRQHQSPQFQVRKNSQMELKTESEFDDMLRAHVKLAKIG